MEFRNLPLNLN
nr:unnamed protein product [Callosobruchus analis]